MDWTYWWGWIEPIVRLFEAPIGVFLFCAIWLILMFPLFCLTKGIIALLKKGWPDSDWPDYPWPWED